MVERNIIPRWVSTDWDRYHEILFHLFQNAIKFNRQDG